MAAVLGLSGCGLLLLAMAAVALRLPRFPVGARIAAMLALALVVFVPFGALSLAAYVRGAIGDLSMTTLVLAGGACVAQITGRNPIGPRDLRAVAWLVALAAVFLYPLALGWTPFDPYALGYGSIGFVTALLVVTLAAWHFRSHAVVLMVVAAGLAYLVGAYDSRNLWDYLIDPVVSLYAVVYLSRQALRRRANTAQAKA